MGLSRRRFMGLLAGAGASTLGSSWLLERVLALEAEGELPLIVGPGVESWLPTACALCPGGCGLEVRRIDGLPVGVRGFGRHPVNRGRLCALPHGAIQMLFSPDRVRRPLKRTGRRGQGMWTEVSWDEAEAAIQERLGTLIAAGSRERVAFLDGRSPGFGRMIATGFMAGIGSPPHVVSAESRSDELARRMFGWDRAPGADLEHSRVVLLFANDHFGTDGSPVWQSQVFALARDRTIDRPVYIGVGPRLLGSMAKCDHWLAVRPGSEGIVALAMAHVILEQHSENREFLRRATDWPEASPTRAHGLQRLVRSITPAIASETAGVPVQQIEEAARRFAALQPGVALVGPGTPAAPTSALTITAVYLLNVLVGAVGRSGGLVERPAPRLSEVWDVTVREPERARAQQPIRDRTELAHALLENEPTPCDLLFVRDANPVFDSPLGQTFRRGLASNDRTLVVFASELDETAALADLVLPEPTFLERWDILTDPPTFPRAHASLQQPAIAPLFGCRQSEEVLARIGNGLGERSHVVFRSTRPDELVRLCARGLMADPHGAAMGTEGIDLPAAGFESFWKALADGIVWAARDVRVGPSAGSQHIRAMPGALLGLPEEPSDELLREWASPINAGAPERYPYELFVFRTPELRDGATTNVPMMMELAGHWVSTMWTTWAEVHPRTAAQAGIADGDTVRVVSERGHIAAMARVSEATPPGLVAIPAGFGHELGATAGRVGANVNLIVAVEAHPSRGQTTRVNLVKG
jgi:anaerobic selenocysteine-containing dehydrogenase